MNPPKGFKEVEIDNINRSIYLKTPSMSRSNQFMKLFIRSKRFNLGILLSTPELSCIKGFVHSVHHDQIIVKY